MIRFLQFSDVHLGAPLRSFGDEAERRRRGLREALRALPQVADDRNVDAVLVAGDLFDSPVPDPADVDVAREVLRRLAESRPVFAIPGNHDRCATADSPWRQMPDGVHVFLEPRFGDGVTVPVGDTNLHVYGLAYDPAVEPQPLAPFTPLTTDGVHVVLLHAGVAENPGWTGGHGLRTTSSELEALGVDYIALGDYHSYRAPIEFLPRNACYSGSFAAVRTSETGPRGVAIVDVGADGPPSATLVPMGLPPLLDLGDVDVGGFGSDHEVSEHIAALPAEDAYPVVRLIGEPSFPLDTERIESAACERFGLALVKDETHFLASDRVERLAREPTIAGHVARLGRARADAGTDEEQEIAERALRLALRVLEHA